MKKGEPVPEQKIVEYKGSTFILKPGHAVFEMNLKSGIVREHPLRRKFDLLFWRKPRYAVEYKEHLIHIPAFSIHRARIAFKHMTKDLNIKVK